MRRSRNIPTILSLLGLLVFYQSLAKEPYQPEIVNPLTETWRWKHFPELQGKGMRCLVEDQQGTVWFGVNEGIIEYDGYDWKWHNEENGLLGTPVEKLYASTSGAIYAATSTGLFVYRDSQWQQILALDSNLEITFHQMRELSNGSLMLSMHLGMIEILKNGKQRVYTSKTNRDALMNSFPNATWVILPEAAMEDESFLDISDILEVQRGKVWMSITLEGHSKILAFHLDKVINGSIQDYHFVRSNKGHAFGESQKMLKTQDNSIWIINTSTNIGIHKYDGKSWDYIELSDLFGGDEFTTDIVQSADGTIWVGALGKLYTYKDKQWEIYKSPEFKIPANRLMLVQSRDNNIWIGGHKSKVYRLDYSASRWMTYKNLNFQCESNRHEHWFLDVSGKVVKRIGNSWVAYNTADGLIDAPVRVIITSKGQVWAAGSHNGVAATAYYDDGKWHRQLHPDLSWGIDYRAVFEAKDGSLWFGAGVDFFREKGQFGGVLQLKNPTEQKLIWVHHKYHENGLNQSNAYGIGQSPDGRIWIGGGNLFYFDENAWDRPEQSCLRQYVNIVTSTDDLLLVGSRYYGIFLYDGEKWKQFDTETGLMSNTIISLHASPDGHIWAATENDISRYDGSNWVNYVFPTEMNLSLEGGAIQQSTDGAIWINKSSREWKRRAFSYSKAPEEAFQNFVSYRYVPDENPPETIIELYSEEVSQQGNTLISWTGEDFFGGTPDERLAYSYRLNDGEWSPFSHETHHTFIDLLDGTYKLEVRARDLDFNVDATPAIANFTVQPPVWKQKWFQ